MSLGNGTRPVTQAYRDAQRHKLNGLCTIGEIVPGAEFVAGVTAPDWLLEGIVQRSRLYACTSLTGHGKTAVWLFIACMLQAGRMVGALRVTQGNVLYLAGENPEDVKFRLLGMWQAYKFKPESLPYVLEGNFPLAPEEAEILRAKIAALGIPFALIVGDTAASYFPGEDENDNVAAGSYARTLRTFTVCDGHPTVVVLTHPTKSAAVGTLLPRGGGAFLNELDANLTLWADGEVTTLHHGKIRGPDFAPLSFRLRPVPTGLIDQWDNPFSTVVAETMTEEAAVDHRKQLTANEDTVLKALRDHPEWMPAQIARDAGWLDGSDQPQRWKVHDLLNRLARDKMIHKQRNGKPWELTEKGLKLTA